MWWFHSSNDKKNDYICILSFAPIWKLFFLKLLLQTCINLFKNSYLFLGTCIQIQWIWRSPDYQGNFISSFFRNLIVQWSSLFIMLLKYSIVDKNSLVYLVSVIFIYFYLIFNFHFTMCWFNTCLESQKNLLAKFASVQQ